MQDLKFVVIPALLRIALKDFVMKLDKYSSLVQQGTRRAVVEGWVNQSVVYDGRQEVILFSVFLILKDFCRILTHFAPLYLLHWVQKKNYDHLLPRYVKLVFVIHVGGTRCITSSTDHIMKILARITLTVEVIRTCIFLFLCYV